MLSKGFYIPTLLFLLTDKKKTIYIQVIELMDTLLFPFILDPDMLMVDFEKADVVPLKTFFPRSILRGLHFHLAQAWMHKI